MSFLGYLVDLAFCNTRKIDAKLRMEHLANERIVSLEKAICDAEKARSLRQKELRFTVDQARLKLKDGDKEGAKNLVYKKRLLEEYIAKLGTTINTFQQQSLTLQKSLFDHDIQAQTEGVTLSLHKMIDIGGGRDHMVKVMEDYRDIVRDSEEMGDAIQGQMEFGLGDVSDYDLEKEFGNLEAEGEFDNVEIEESENEEDEYRALMT